MKAAIKVLAPNSGSAVEDMVVGVVDDGSESMLAAFWVLLQRLLSQPTAKTAPTRHNKMTLRRVVNRQTKGSLEDMQAQYRDAGCIVAVL